MLGLGLSEILVIAAIALVVVGPEQLPKLLRTLGRWYGQARRAADDLRRAFVLEADRQDAAERYARLQERRKAAEEARAKAKAASAEDPETDVDDGAEGGEADGPPGPVPQSAPYLHDLDEVDDVPTDPHAHATAGLNDDPPDAPHPTRPTPTSGEFP